MGSPPGGLRLRFRNRDLPGVPRVQDHCQDARVALRGRVLRHAVQAAGRLVERVPRLERLGRLVVDGPLVLALQDVPDHRAGVAVRLASLTGVQRHFHDRYLRLLAVQLLDDVPRGDRLHSVLLVMVSQAIPPTPIKAPAAKTSAIRAPPPRSPRFPAFMIALLLENADRRWRQPGGITVTTVLPGRRLRIGSRVYAAAA